MSWEDIEKQDESKNFSNDELDKFCTLCHQVFCIDPSGKEVLQILSDHLNSPVCPPDKSSSYGYFREGQNNIIRQIKNAINYHKEKIRRDNV